MPQNVKPSVILIVPETDDTVYIAGFELSDWLKLTGAAKTYEEVVKIVKPEHSERASTGRKRCNERDKMARIEHMRRVLPFPTRARSLSGLKMRESATQDPVPLSLNHLHEPN